MASPVLAANAADIIDVEFETVTMPLARAMRRAPADAIPAPLADCDGLHMLRGAETSTAAAPADLTPSFLIFTAIAAFVVFWVSGGSALMY